MQPFVHLHVHSQYSVLDGQASIQALVDKAHDDGMPGIALTDHGNMFGVKEFYNYIKKKNGKLKSAIQEIEQKIAAVTDDDPDKENKLAELQTQLEKAKSKKPFKPIIGCEMYVARKRLHDKNGKEDQSGYHLIVLAKTRKVIITSSNSSRKHGQRVSTCVLVPTAWSWKNTTKGSSLHRLVSEEKFHRKSCTVHPKR